jgi:hypothetical protein
MELVKYNDRIFEEYCSLEFLAYEWTIPSGRRTFRGIKVRDFIRNVIQQITGNKPA